MGMRIIKKLLDLYFTFLKIGASTFGSGYAMLPIVYHEISVKKKWLSDDEISDYLAFSQSLPGVIAINISCFVGKKIAGVIGALISCVGVITCPSIIIFLISCFFSDITKFSITKKIIASLQPVITAIVLLACTKIYKTNIKDRFQIIIFVLGVIAFLFFKISTQYIIISACILSCLYKRLVRNIKK